MRLNIFHKFLLVIAIIVLPFVVFSIHHYFEMAREEMDHIYKENLLLSRRVASEMDSLMENTWSLLKGLSMHSAVVSLDSQGCDRIASQLFKDYPLYLNIIGARMDGSNFCSAVADPTASKNLNYRDKEWFQKGTGGKPYAGNVHISNYFKKPAIMLTRPVFKDGTQIAVLGASLDLEKVQARLKEEFSGYKDLEIIILDRTGEVIVNTKNPGKTVGIDLKEKEGNFMAKGPDGIERLYSLTTSENGWKVLAGIPMSYAYSHAFMMSRRYLVIMVALTIVGLSIAHLFTRRLKKRFKLLMDGIGNVERRDLSSRIHLYGNDELGKLASAFNTMVERLEAVHKSLIESEAFYHSLSVNSSDIVLMVEPSGKIIYASPSIDGLGYTPQEVKGRTIFELIDPYYAPEVKGQIDGLINRPGEIQSITLRVFHKDGSMRFLATKGRYVKDRDCLIINCIDISEEKKKESLINGILSSISEGFLIIDRQYRIVSANRSYLERMKTDLLKIKGRHCYEISHRTERPCYELGEHCPVKETFMSGESAMAMHIHYTATGDPLYVEIRSYPIKDPSGAVVNVVESIVDLTEQKRLEAQLRQSQKLEAIGQLAGGVAHDFNNILTAISGFGSLLDIKLPQESPLKEYIAEIMKAVERGSNLAKGLLAFSRKQPGNPQPVDLNEIVRMMTKLLSKLIREDIRLEMDLFKEELIIMADAGHLEQVIMNLATNARDAMPDGGVLTLKTERIYMDERFRDIHGYGKEGEYALLSVSDTGIGMDEHIKARMFEPFFTTKEEGKGTGLGLSVVYGLVKQYNGYINVYSELGKGSIFKIYFPLYTGEEKVEPSKKRQVVFTKGHGETILLVDDDREVRESIRHVLDFAGYKVIEASDGLEALDIFRHKMDQIDLVITDLIMPKKNGKALYDDIKALKPLQKVLFISGHTADSLYKQYLPEDGLIIFKPVLPSEFLRKIREFIS